MIGNITKGAGFGGAARYVLEKEGAEYLDGTFDGETWQDIKEEVNLFRKEMSADKEAFHASISLDDNERLTDVQWREVAATYLEGVGLENTPHIVVRHTDTDHDHIHIVALRYDLETRKTPSEWKDYERTEAVLRTLEKTYGLRELEPKQERQDDVRGPTDAGELARDERIGRSPREAIQDAFEDALDDKPKSFRDFMDAMERRGIIVQPHIQSTGRLSGVKYLDLESGVTMKSSTLGKAYGVPALKTYGVTYDEREHNGPAINRDGPARGSPDLESPDRSDRRQPEPISKEEQPVSRDSGSSSAASSDIPDPLREALLSLKMERAAAELPIARPSVIKADSVPDVPKVANKTASKEAPDIDI